MQTLTQHIKETTNRIDAALDGWTYGRLVIEDGQAYLQLDSGDMVPVNGAVEVENGDHWQQLNKTDLERKTGDGWPAYAGLLARMKPIEGR